MRERMWNLPPSLDNPVSVVLAPTDPRVPACSLCGSLLMAQEREDGHREFQMHMRSTPDCRPGKGGADGISTGTTRGEPSEEPW